MNKRDRVRIEQINRIADFAQANKADLNSLTGAAKTNALGLLASLTTKDTGIVDRLQGFETGREAGAIDFHEGAATKATLRDGIMQELADWNEAAGTIAASESTPEIMKGFRLPHGVSGEAFGAKVRAICDHAEGMATKFTALAFDDDFVEQMRTRITDFEAADGSKEAGMNDKTGARSGLSATIREGVVAGRQLNVIFKKIYKDDAEKRTAWATAFHTDRVGVSARSKKNTGNGNGNGVNGNGQVAAPAPAPALVTA